jgi:protein TonB
MVGAPVSVPVARGKTVVTGSGTMPDSAGPPVVGPSFDAAYLNNPAPRYPAIARKMRLQGVAIIRVMVTTEGRPNSVRLEKSSGARMLDEAALEAVQHWSFVPARRGDKAVPAEVDVPVRFRLN